MTQMVNIDFSYIRLHFNSLVFQSYKNQFKYSNITRGLWQ